MRAVHVVGGGPAGAMAAFAAMREGAPVRIFEKSAFPRHKVCGEFLSPAILPLLRRAGCGATFLALRPAVLRSMRLHFGTRVIRHPLPESAYGLSRYELDRLLRTRRKRRRASGSRALVHRRPGSCSYPRRRPQVHRSSWRVALLPSGQRVGLQFSKIGQRISTYWNSCPAVRLVACRVVSKPDSPNPLRRWVPLGDFSGQLE